jgi:very-short-patch-repair endonuclease
MRDKRDIGLEIAALAGRQGGVVGIGQLLAAELTRAAVSRRVAAGVLHPLQRGVYAVGHRHLGAHGRRWAAVLAYAPDGVLSDRTAAAAYGWVSGGGMLHVTVPATGRRRRDGVRLHRRRLASDETTRLDGVPITTPARTLLDLAIALPAPRLITVISRAEQHRLLDFADLHALLRRHHGRAGAASMRAALARYGGPRDTRSELEDLIAELCDRHRLERPEHNVVVEGFARDFAWPARRLVVEGDSFTWHRTPTALDADRERDLTLVLSGWRALRFTHHQVTRRPAWVGAAIRAALADR